MILTDCVGFAASIAVLASFCMTTILPLRSFALASNVLFILYGLLGHIYPVLFLHVVLLPVNVIKLRQLSGPRAVRQGSRVSLLRQPPLIE